MGKVISLYSGDDPRDRPVYRLGEAAIYLGIPHSTLHGWVKGKKYRVRGGVRATRPLIKADKATGLLSFNNFVEAYMLASLTRGFDVPLARVRQALSYIGGDRPLLTTAFRTDGRGIFVESMGALIDASQGGQAAFRPLVEASLKRVDLDDQRRPSRLYPWRRDIKEPKVIALDPRRAFGQPIIAGSSVKMEVVVDRFQAGESTATLAADYGMNAEVIESVVRWGLDAAKAA